MKKVALVVCMLMVAGLLLAPAASASDKKTHEMTATIVSTNLEGKTITIKDEKGTEMTAPVLAEAVGSLKSLKAGDTVVLTCLDNDKGEHQGVSAIKPAKK